MIAWPRPRASALRLLVMAVADRCDQRCRHCQIWQGEGGPALTLDERLRLADDALAAGARAVLLTGGEPLLSPDLWPLAERFRSGGARVMLATNGMLLGRFAGDVARLVDEVYVSLDGPGPAVHDAWRGVAAFDRVAAGVAAVRAAAPRLPIVARCVLHAGTIGLLAETIDSARSLGFDHVSFLALDASSGAFGARPADRRALVPTPSQVAAFEDTVLRLARAGGLSDGFVAESPAKLRGLARHLRASAGEGSFARPACDAPWWSSVVEADGTLRPCFFHEPVGDARDGLSLVRGGGAYRAALGRIARANETCARCVCPKKGWGAA